MVEFKMDHISNDELQKVPQDIVVKNSQGIQYNDETIVDIATLMNSPLEVQKEEAAIIYNYLFQKRRREIEEKGIISDHTRRVMEGYHALLDSIQKAIHGTKNINMNLNGELAPHHIHAFIKKYSGGKK